ncbi:hypothetical protein B0H19DRAFT_942384, partial [Mycena capillaripes]
NAHWTPRNEAKLLSHLVEKRATAGDGMSFTKPTFMAAAAAVNEDSLEKGGPKTWEACKSKFQKLKALFLLICEVIGNSGWTWSDEHGACIDASSSGVWDAFVKNRPLAAPFRNAGWAHLEAFRTLMPESTPRGAHCGRGECPTRRLLDGSVVR